MSRKIDGILLLDKPAGLSSNRALQQVKRHLQAQKAGHGGTLDPLATGMLPLFFGQATKYAQFHLNAEKIYRFTLALGARTTTADCEGDIIERQAVPLLDSDSCQRVLARFLGDSLQTPPQYSAIKVDGKALYRYARDGKQVDVAARPVTIHCLDLLTLADNELILQARVSKGTYIRSLAEDIAAALGTCGHVTDLRRLSVGEFQTGMVPLADLLQISEKNQLDAMILPVDSLVQHLPHLVLTSTQTQQLYYGQPLDISLEADANTLLRLYHNERYLGLGRWTASQLVPQRLMVQ